MKKSTKQSKGKQSAMMTKPICLGSIIIKIVDFIKSPFKGRKK